MSQSEFDTQRAADYVRGLLYVPAGAAVRNVLCPPGGGPTSTTTTTSSSSSSSSSSSTVIGDVDVPPVDLIAKEVGSTGSVKVFLVVNQLGAGGAVMVKQFLPTHKTLSKAAAAALSTASATALAGLASPAERAAVEAALVSCHGALCPGKFATLLHSESSSPVLVYERLEPHAVARLELVNGTQYPLLAEDCSVYLARSLYGTSAWGMPSIGVGSVSASSGSLSPSTSVCLPDVPEAAADATRNLLVELLLDGPLGSGPQGAAGWAPRFANKHTPSAALDAWANSLHSDEVLKEAVSRLRQTLLTSRECLLHGDFSTSSLMCAVITPGGPKATYEAVRPQEIPKNLTPEQIDALIASQPKPIGDLRIIGGQTAFRGPAGLDVGTIVAHFLLAMAAARARARSQDAVIARGGYAKYTAQRTREKWEGHCANIAEVVGDVWAQFVARVVDAWDHDRVTTHTVVDEETGCCGSDAQAPAPAAAVVVEDDGCGCGDGCGDGDDHSHSAPAHVHVHASSPKARDDGFWRQQVTVLANVFRDAVGFAGAEIARRVLGAIHVADLDSLEPPTPSRTAAEMRLLALSKYLITNAEALATSALHRALAFEKRDDGVRILASAMDVIVAAAAAIEGEQGWVVVDTAKPTTAATTPAPAPSTSLPGRSVVATLVIDAAGVDADAVSAVAARFENVPGEGEGAAILHRSCSSLRRVIAGLPEDAALPPGGWERMPSTPTAVFASANASTSEPTSAGASAPASSPTAIQSSLVSLVRCVWGPIVAISAASPVTWEDVSAALRAADVGACFSGKGIAAIPPHAPVIIAQEAAAAPSEVAAEAAAGVTSPIEQGAVIPVGLPIRDAAAAGMEVRKPAPPAEA